jgi:hypothetical protein
MVHTSSVELLEINFARCDFSNSHDIVAETLLGVIFLTHMTYWHMQVNETYWHMSTDQLTR